MSWICDTHLLKKGIFKKFLSLFVGYMSYDVFQWTACLLAMPALRWQSTVVMETCKDTVTTNMSKNSWFQNSSSLFCHIILRQTVYNVWTIHMVSLFSWGYVAMSESLIKHHKANPSCFKPNKRHLAVQWVLEYAYTDWVFLNPIQLHYSCQQR